MGIKRVHLNNPFYGFQEFYLYVVVFLQYSLESVSATCKQLSQELMEKYEELKKMEGHNNEYRTEIKKVRPCVPGSQRWMYLWAMGRVGRLLMRDLFRKTDVQECAWTKSGWKEEVHWGRKG